LASASAEEDGGGDVDDEVDMTTPVHFWMPNKNGFFRAPKNTLIQLQLLYACLLAYSV